MKPVIIGAGLAGLSVALALAPEPVIVLSSRKLGEACSSSLAQGGIAAALGADDTAFLHAEDTIKAGADLCNPAIVHQVTAAAAGVIADFLSKGVPFDRDAQNQLRLTLEAAHGRNRIVHVADGTGFAVMRAMIAAVRQTPSIEIREDTTAIELLADGNISGVAINHQGNGSTLQTKRVILATGGAGGLWRHTTNPLTSWGQGLALAARIGALLGDLEFVQFHPTAIDAGRDPMPLASEALRGEGCILIDEKGERFMAASYPRAELEARDVVARAIWDHSVKGRRVFLDARQAIGSAFPKRFPGIYALCRAAGIDPLNEPIPVRPAAHYHMGGVVTDARGRTNIEGLWACGEVANTGLHGANRLASNSLLEAASFGIDVATDVAAFRSSSATQSIKQKTQKRKGDLHKKDMNIDTEIRAIMSSHVGVLRHQEGLEIAVSQLAPLATRSDMALVGLMIATAALLREESRGAHSRTDFPATRATAEHSLLTLADVMRIADHASGYSSRQIAKGA